VIFGKSGVDKKVSKKDEPVYAYMLGLATGNPKYRVSQKDAVKVAMQAKGCENIRGVMERIYGNTRISHRYMAIPGEYTSTTCSGDARV
jgi:predicted naringenin-chalcone synthase